MIKFHSSVLFVNNIEVSKKFYIDVLKLTIEHDFGTNVALNGGISLWQIRPNHIIPSKLKNTQLASNRFELCFETDNIDDFKVALDKHNLEYLHEKMEEPWGQFTMRFFDPDKHLIEVGETLLGFVSRMANQGMSAEQISEKTGISLYTVKQFVSRTELAKSNKAI